MKPVSDRVDPQRRRSLPELPRTPWPAPLANRVRNDAGAAQIAAALDSLWREVDRVLSPIVGLRGVSALFERSLQVAHRTDPRLVALRDDGEQPLDPIAFASLIASLTDADAARWGIAFLQTFHALLVSLIGPSLTERLLHTAWGPPSPDPPAQGLHDSFYEAVEVHQRQVVINRAMDRSCIDAYRFMAGRVETAQGCGEKIFFSRSRIEDSRGNDLSFDMKMQELGYTVVHPQELPLREQISIAKGARTLAGFDGSALHLSVFMQPGGVVEVIGSRSAANTVICNQLSGQETRRIHLPYAQ